MAKHRDGSDQHNHSATSKAHQAKHGIPDEATVPLRADFDSSGRLTGFGVGRPQGADNYTER